MINPRRPAPPPRARAFKPAVATTNPLPIILGAVGVVLVVVLFVVMSGSKNPPAPAAAPPPPPAAPKPVDVTGLEREGYKLCNEGTAIIRSLSERMDKSATLSVEDQKKLRAEIKTGYDKIRKGMEYFGEANEKAGRTFDTATYVQTMKYASNKIKELPE